MESGRATRDDFTFIKYLFIMVKPGKWLSVLESRHGYYITAPVSLFFNPGRYMCPDVHTQKLP